MFGNTWFILKDSINSVILNSFHSLVSVVNFKTVVIIVVIIVIVAINVDSFIIFSLLQIENVGTLRNRYRTRNYLLLGSQKFIRVTTQAFYKTISSARSNSQSCQCTLAFEPQFCRKSPSVFVLTISALSESSIQLPLQIRVAICIMCQYSFLLRKQIMDVLIRWGKISSFHWRCETSDCGWHLKQHYCLTVRVT